MSTEGTARNTRSNASSAQLQNGIRGVKRVTCHAMVLSPIEQKRRWNTRSRLEKVLGVCEM